MTTPDVGRTTYVDRLVGSSTAWDNEAALQEYDQIEAANRAAYERMAPTTERRAAVEIALRRHARKRRSCTAIKVAAEFTAATYLGSVMLGGHLPLSYFCAWFLGAFMVSWGRGGRR